MVDIVDATKEHGVLVKVIIGTVFLTDEEKVKEALSQNAGADYVETSTGFAGRGQLP